MKKYENTTDTKNKTTDTNMRYKLEAKYKKNTRDVKTMTTT